jgi:hypothetical protein
MSVILEALKKSQHQRPSRSAVPIRPRRQRVRFARSSYLLSGALVAAIVAIGLAAVIALRSSPQPAAPGGQPAEAVTGPVPLEPVQAGAPSGPVPPPGVFAVGAAPGRMSPSAAAVAQAGEPVGHLALTPSETGQTPHTREATETVTGFVQPIPQTRSGTATAAEGPAKPPPSVTAMPEQPRIRPLATQHSSLGGDSDARASASALEGGLPFVTPLEEVQGSPNEPLSDAAKAIEAVAPSPVPRLDELPMAFRHELPKFSLDVHSYDVDDSKRFVLINLTKLREGEYLTPETSVVEIVSDGVVLDHNGMRFLLPTSN